jgi:Fuc2NAc and GlcNAc transferase
MTVQLLSFLALTACSYAMTRIAIVISAKLGIRDLPNPRSSHDRPTLRGGGIAIVVVFALGVGLGIREVPLALSCGILVPGVAVAAIGYADDIRGLSARTRLAIHLLASLAAASLAFLATHQARSAGDALWIAIFALGIAWLINLTNFMDGIDGILGVQAVTASLVAALLCSLRHDAWMANVYLALAAGSLGFLFLNWSPARIFMGDVGSGFVGFVFGALMVACHLRGTLPLETGLIVFAVFTCDATYTLLVRAARGCDLTAAHRDHAYQKAVQRGLSHAQVSSAVGGINCLWLAFWAWLSLQGHPGLCLVLACLPLLAIASYLRAGFPAARSVLRREAAQRRLDRPHPDLEVAPQTRGIHGRAGAEGLDGSRQLGDPLRAQG